MEKVRPERHARWGHRAYNLTERPPFSGTHPVEVRTFRGLVASPEIPLGLPAGPEAGIPAGMRSTCSSSSGGVVASLLNHRLPALNPSGSENGVSQKFLRFLVEYLGAAPVLDHFFYGGWGRQLAHEMPLRTGEPLYRPTSVVESMEEQSGMEFHGHE